MKKTAFLLGVTSLIMCTAFAQELPRSASFGALVADLNDSTAHLLQLPFYQGHLA
jgi:hypothetical protein